MRALDKSSSTTDLTGRAAGRRLGMHAPDASSATTGSIAGLSLAACAAMGAAFMPACSSDDGAGGTAPFADAAVGSGDAGGMPPALRFESTVIAGLNTEALIGDNAVLALDPSGEPTVAYGVVPFGTIDREVHFARRSADGQWASEVVTTLGEDTPGGDLVGLGFTYVGAVPHIVYIGGDDDGIPLTPYPTDLVLATRAGGQWTETILADVSNEAPVDCGPSDYCNRGNVVGTHAAIAALGNAYAVGYRDTHFGFGELDDSQSDVEVVASGLAAFERSVPDPVRGGGRFTDIALTPDGRPLLAYTIEAEQPPENRVGVWSAVWRNNDWTLAKVSDSLTTSRTSVAITSDGATFYVAFFDSTNQQLALATSVDDGDSWTTEVVEASGKVGLHPSLALDDQDRPVIAYTYCGRTSDATCPGSLGSRSEVRLARRDGAGWDTSTVVDNGQGQGGVGFFNSLAIGPDGTIYVAFQDTRNSDLVIAESQP